MHFYKYLLISVLFFINAIAIDQIDKKENISFTEKESQFLKEHPVVRFSGMLDWQPYDFVKNGISTGYSSDYVKLLAKKAGFKVEFVQDSWDNLVGSFKDRKIDVMQVFSKTKEREKFTLYTDKPYVVETYGIVSVKDRAYSSLIELDEKKVAMGKGWYATNIIKKLYPKINIIEYDGSLQCFKAVLNRQVDAAIDGIGTSLYYILEEGMNNLIVQGNVDLGEQIDPNMYFGVRDDWPQLKSVLQKAQNLITQNEKNELNKKWLGINNTPDIQSTIKLTKEEKEFLKKHPLIKAHNDQDWAPFNFYENGQATGYTVDLVKLLAKKIGVKIEFISGPTWDEFIEMFKKKEIDLIISMSQTTDRDKFTEFTDPIIKEFPSIISSGNKPFGSLEELEGKTLAVINGFWYEEVLKKYYPNIKRYMTNNSLENLKAVLYNKADATLETASVAQYLMSEHAISGLEVSAEANIKNANKYFTRIGVRKDWKIFRDILNKALRSVDYKELHILKNKWLTYEEKQIKLSEEEENYLKDKKTIKMCVDPDWEPYERLDSSGKYVGFAADLIHLIENKINKKMELVKTNTWSESLDFVKKGRCEIASFLNKTPSREHYLNFTGTLYSEPEVIVAKNDVTYINGFSELENKTVGIVKGYKVDEFIKSNYPKVKIKYVTNYEEGLKLVSEGKVYASINSLLGTTYLIRKLNLVNIKIAGENERSK